MPTIGQIRAARALLDWSQTDLAEKSGLSQTGIARLENGTHAPNTATIEKITAAFVTSGIEFIDEGVRKAKDRLLVYRDLEGLELLQSDIYNTIGPTGDEILILGLDEISPEEDKEGFEQSKKHIQDLIESGASERILAKHGMQNFLGPKHWYRWVPEEYFCPYTILIYGTKIALLLRENEIKILILDNPYFTESMVTFFNFIWAQAEKVK